MSGSNKKRIIDDGTEFIRLGGSGIVCGDGRHQQDGTAGDGNTVCAADGDGDAGEAIDGNGTWDIGPGGRFCGELLPQSGDVASYYPADSGDAGRYRRGYFVMKVISNAQLKPIIGVIVVMMLAINWWRNRAGEDVPTQWWFAEVMGFFAGATTMMANAAGPVMIVYLLAMRLPKVEFVGTSAWFFFIVNWLKVPFSIHLGLVNVASIKLGFIMLPFIIIGAVLGIVALKKMPQKVFEITIQVLALAAAIKLLF